MLDNGGPTGLADGTGAALQPTAGMAFTLRVTGTQMTTDDRIRIVAPPPAGPQLGERDERQEDRCVPQHSAAEGTSRPALTHALL